MNTCKLNEWESRQEWEEGMRIKGRKLRTSLAVQGLRLCVSNTGGVDLIPGRGTKIPCAVCVQPKFFKKRKKKLKGS